MIEPESSQVPLFSTCQPTVDSTNQESPDMYENVPWHTVYAMDLDIAEGLTEDGNSRTIVSFSLPLFIQVKCQREDLDLNVTYYSPTTPL